MASYKSAYTGLQIDNAINKVTNNVYTKTEIDTNYYTKSEVDSAISTAINNIINGDEVAY